MVGGTTKKRKRSKDRAYGNRVMTAALESLSKEERGLLYEFMDHASPELKAHVQTVLQDLDATEMRTLVESLQRGNERERAYGTFLERTFPGVLPARKRESARSAWLSGAGSVQERLDGLLDLAKKELGLDENSKPTSGIQPFDMQLTGPHDENLGRATVSDPVILAHLEKLPLKRRGDTLGRMIQGSFQSLAGDDTKVLRDISVEQVERAQLEKTDELVRLGKGSLDVVRSMEAQGIPIDLHKLAEEWDGFSEKKKEELGRQARKDLPGLLAKAKEQEVAWHERAEKLLDDAGVPRDEIDTADPETLDKFAKDLAHKQEEIAEILSEGEKFLAGVADDPLEKVRAIISAMEKKKEKEEGAKGYRRSEKFYEEPEVEKVVRGPERILERRQELKAAREPSATIIPIEKVKTKRTQVKSVEGTFEIVRREGSLVTDYVDFMAAKGDSLARYKIRTPTTTLISDCFNLTRAHLIEAKSDASRSSIRYAIGQLLDYERWIRSEHPTVRMALLTPERPIDELLELLSAFNIVAVWKEQDIFTDNADGGFTK